MQARLIVPKQTNDGKGTSAYCDLVRKQLIAIIGGYTQFDGIGGYRGEKQDYHEPITIFDLDFPDGQSEAITLKLRTLAKTIVRSLRQESVYLRIEETVYFVEA